MNYTENYHLPQWEETDRIMLTDFNQMCADVEAGLKTIARAASDAAAGAASPDSVARAQRTADSALSAANAAQETADAAYSPSSPPFVVGAYTGIGGTNGMTVPLGFTPRLVLVCDASFNGLYHLVGSGNSGGKAVTCVNNGFSVTNYTFNEFFANLNDYGVVYPYVAFK